MLLHKSYRFELNCDAALARQMSMIAGCVRFVYNKALALQKARQENGESCLNYPALCRELTTWRNSPETAFLKEPPTHPLQQTLKALTGAYRAFFEKRAQHPRFKERGRDDSFRFPDPRQFKLDQPNSRIFLPKLGWIRYRNSRNVSGRPKIVTVLRNGDKWYISILTEHEVNDPIHPSTSVVGLDMGIAVFATLSDGSVYESVNSYRKHEAHLVRVQRAWSRKQKFSANWVKQKRRIQRIHQKIGRIRFDHINKASTEISNKYSVVVIEALSVQQMTSTNSRCVKRQGLRRAMKIGMNKSILDQGWSSFRRQLQYKELWRGGRVIAVSSVNTSRTCSVCGSVSAENRKTQAAFRCVECGHAENADLNAAKNILAAGHAVMACVANGATKPSAAGTHRSDSTGVAVGVPE
jgi:putative transposase